MLNTSFSIPTPSCSSYQAATSIISTSPARSCIPLLGSTLQRTTSVLTDAEAPRSTRAAPFHPPICCFGVVREGSRQVKGGVPST